MTTTPENTVIITATRFADALENHGKDIANALLNGKTIILRQQLTPDILSRRQPIIIRTQDGLIEENDGQRATFALQMGYEVHLIEKAKPEPETVQPGNPPKHHAFEMVFNTNDRHKTLKEAIMECGSFMPRSLEPSDGIWIGAIAKEGKITIYPNDHRRAKQHEKPLTKYCYNGVIANQYLSELERNLRKGFITVLTGVSDDVAVQPETPDVNPPKPSENRITLEGEPEDYEKAYWNLRTALRMGIQRATGISLQDPAEIANHLRETDNLDQAAESFRIMIEQAFADGENKGIENAIQQREEDQRKARNKLLVLEEAIRIAMKVAKGEPHTGGTVQGKSITIPAYEHHAEVVIPIERRTVDYLRADQPFFSNHKTNPSESH